MEKTKALPEQILTRLSPLHNHMLSVIQCYFHVQQDILQFSPGKSSISNVFVEGLLDKANHSLELPNVPWCFGEVEVPLDVQLGKEICAVVHLASHFASTLLHPQMFDHYSSNSSLGSISLRWIASRY